MTSDPQDRRSFLKRSAAVLAVISGFTLEDVFRGERFAHSETAKHTAIVDLEQSAVAKLIESLGEHFDLAISDVSLRVGIEGDEKSGFKAIMGFEYEHQGNPDRDVSLVSHGVRIVVDRDCVAALTGTSISLVERDGREGFQFTGPFFDKRS